MKPIIFIPGIEATSLVDSNTFDFEMRWNAFDTLGTSAWNKITGPIIKDKLQINSDYDEDMHRIIERNHIARLPYERSIQDISLKFPKDPIYLFGYDWRMSNYSNGHRLQKFVEYLKQKLQGNELEGFRFVTHSMGGLVFQGYLSQPNTDLNDIDRAVICAPPFKGSPLALVHMVKGDGGIKGFFRKIFGNNDDIRKVVRTYPSIFELTPWYDNALLFSDNSEPVNLLNIYHWQSNIYDDILELFSKRLSELSEVRNSNMRSLADFPQEFRERLTILAGSKDKTVIQLNVFREKNGVHNFVDLDHFIPGSGDGTVPFESSTIYKDSIQTLEVPKKNLFQEFGDVVDFHGLFIRDSRVLNIINRAFEDGGMAIKRNRDIKMGRYLNPDHSRAWWASIDDSVKDISQIDGES